MNSGIFRCEQCAAPFVTTPNPCCPPVFRGIVNCGPLNDMKPDWRNRTRAWNLELEQFVHDIDWITSTFQSTSIGKYLPGAEGSNGKQAYERCCRWSGIQEGVVLDFGCCLTHGSAVVKKFAPDAIYLGVDQEPLFLAIASQVYEPDFLYLSRRYEDLAFPLRHIASHSVDLLISSCLTSYNNCSAFLAEWLRVLKPEGLLYLETHSLSAFEKLAVTRKVEPYPTLTQRRLIADWLNRHFVLTVADHSVADFVNGRTRMVGQFQLSR